MGLAPKFFLIVFRSLCTLARFPSQSYVELAFCLSCLPLSKRLSAKPRSPCLARNSSERITFCARFLCGAILCCAAATLSHLLVEAGQVSHAFAIGKRIAFYACFSSSHKSFAAQNLCGSPVNACRQSRALLVLLGTQARK